VLSDVSATEAQVAVAVTMQNGVWAGVLAALKDAPPQAMIVVIPALNQTIDVTTTRATAQHTHTQD